jgi:anaerobic dimethyl sulfoxide reductase subunit A
VTSPDLPRWRQWLAGALPWKTLAAPVPERREDGRWVPAACWHDCGGRCALKALVVDGTVVRLKTDDTHPDSPDFPQQRACVRGRAQRGQVFAPDRLKYPMRRRHWAPGGGDRDRRGRDEWVRISWDEALDLVAGEIRRVLDTCGSTALFNRGGEVKRVFNLLGGCVDSWSTCSHGAWMATGKLVGLYPPAPGGGFDWTTAMGDRMDLRLSRLIVMWGVNPAWSSPGSPTWHFLQARKAGARFVFVDPFYSASAALLADDWIPVRPGTDHALALGMMHTLLAEDDPERDPLVDWDLLARCTVGFDPDHMPPGADPADNLRDYLLGRRDGVPKTADWAARICGVPPERIRGLARELARAPRAALLTSWAPARVNNADAWPQAFLALGCMTGHLGRPGDMTGTSAHYASGNGGPPLVYAGDDGLAPVPNPVGGADDYTFGRPARGTSVCCNELWDAILAGRYRAGRDDLRPLDLRLLYSGGDTNLLGSRQEFQKGVKAFRKMECVVTHAQFLTTTAKYSDIVLPVTTPWERFGWIQGSFANREALFFGSRVVEPLFEARDDMWIARELGARLGLDPALVEPVSLPQRIFNAARGARVVRPDGDGYEPLVAITAEDIAALGVQGQPQEGRIRFAELRERGVYQVPRSPGDRYGHVPLRAFREDPDGHPLATASGKLELHCQALADFVGGCGWDDQAPIPAYHPAREGFEATFADFEAGAKGRYPLQFFSVHYLRRANSTCDNVSWLREAWPHEFFLNPLDAGPRGIRTGDTVRVRSPHGAVLRRACVTPRIMPGVATMGSGAWAELDEAEQLDRAGSASTLAGLLPNGQGLSGFNSCIVEVERSGEALAADADWAPRRPRWARGERP